MFEFLFLKLISFLDTLPPLVILLLPKSNKGLRGSFIFYYVSIQLFFNLTANILNQINWHNLYLYHLNCYFSFIVLSLFFKQLFNTILSEKIIYWIAIIYTLFFFYNIFSWEGMEVFNSNTFGLASFILCGYSLHYYLKLFQEPGKENISKSPSFWFNTAIFSYYTANFFIFLTYNKLTHDSPPLLIIIWQLHNIIFLIMCIYIFIGSLCKQSMEK